MVREEGEPVVRHSPPVHQGPVAPGHDLRPAAAVDGGSGASDAALVAALAGGDQRAVATLYDRYGGLAYGLAYRILQDRAAAQDVVQGVFISIWRGAAGCALGHDSLCNPLLATVHRRAVDRLRGAAGHDGLLDEWDRPPARDEPGRAVEGASQRKTLERGLLALPAAQRRAIELAYFEGRTQAEIAGLLGVPVSAARGHMRDGLHALGESLAGTSGSGEGVQ